MANPQDNEKGFNLSRKDSFNLLYAVARGHAMCFLPFFRKNFGSEALGVPGLIAFVLMLLVGGFGEIPEMLYFMGLWLVAMLYQRTNTMVAMWKGVVRHSRYEGDVDTKLIRNRSTVKLILEPVTCGLFGLCIEMSGISHGLAVFIGMGFFSLSAVAWIDRQLEHKRLEAMRDAAIEQSYLASRYRGETEEP
jgi:hypothetical protein